MMSFHFLTPSNHQLPLVETSPKDWVYAMQARVLAPSTQILTQDTYINDHTYMDYGVYNINV